MPTEVEAKLRDEASKKGLKGKHADAYVYGTMNKAGSPRLRPHDRGEVMDLNDPTLQLLSAALSRIEALEVRAGAHEKAFEALENRVMFLAEYHQKQLSAVSTELHAHTHAQRMHGGPGGPAHEIQNLQQL